MAEYSEIELRGNPANLSDALKRAYSYVETFLDTVKSGFDSVLDTLGLSYEKVISKITQGISDFEESASKNRQIDLMLKSMGDHAGHTAGQLAKMRTEIRKISSASLDEIRSAQRELLKFSRIRFPVFEQVMRVADDFKEVLGTDLSTAAERLGSALQNPAEGLDALQDHLWDMSRAMKEQIRWWTMTGDIQKAQVAILNHLSSLYKGAGAAAADTFGSKMAKIREETQKMWETIAGALLPYLNKIIDVYNHFGRVVERVVKNFQTAGLAQNDTVQAVFDFVVSVLKKIIDYFVIAFSAIEAVVLTWEKTWEKTWNYIKGYTFAALAAILRGVIALSRMASDAFITMGKVLSSIWGYIVKVAQAAFRAIMDAAVVAWQAILNAATTVAKALSDVWKLIAESAGKAVEYAGYMMFRGLVKVAGLIYKLIWNTAGELGSLAAKGVAGWLSTSNNLVGAFFSAVAATAKAIWNVGVTTVKAAYTVAKNLAEVATEGIAGYIGSSKAVFEALTGFVSGVARLAYNTGETVMSIAQAWPQYIANAAVGIVQGLMNAHTKFGQFFKGLWNTAKHWLDKLQGKDVAEDAPEESDWLAGLQEQFDATMAKMKAGLEDVKNKFKDLPEFTLPEFTMPDLNKMTADLEAAAKEALDKAGAIDPGLTDAFNTALGKNRQAVEDFYKWYEKTGLADPSALTPGKDPGQMKGIFDAASAAGQNSAGRFEDLKALNQRIQSSAARAPELDELKKQTALMQMQNRILFGIANRPPKPKNPIQTAAVFVP